jgi:chemotaxis protein methyltransferase CheR
MQAASYEYVAKLIRDSAAIDLSAGKEYLVESRLTRLAREVDLTDVDALVSKLKKGGCPDLERRAIEAMTTNETSFFRDIKPFELLRTEVLPTLIRARSAQRQLNLWCAASSSGQEPYTIAMILRERFPELAGWKVNFLATDLSQEMVDRCKAGRFTQLEVNRGLPSALLVKYFKRDGTSWVVCDELRASVDFRQMNLIRPWPSMPALDIVLIRNVLIYFDAPTKKAILGNIRKRLAPDGYLVLGNAETPVFLDVGYEEAGKSSAGFYRIKAA